MSQWRELYSGDSEPLLKALHILTRDGQLNQDSRRKLKQVLHLVQFLTPKLGDVKSVVDFGAGKSYLGFLLYDLHLKSQTESELYAVEERPELIRKCKEIASQSKFDRIHFVESKIEDTIEKLPTAVDAVVALHACDTATDDAIAAAIKMKAKLIAVVPCCQAEVARSLESIPRSDIDALWDQGIHRREFGSHLTNVIRCLVLESKGYKVRATEFVGFEHSMKNELILAEKHQNSNPAALRRLQSLLSRLPVKMKLLEQVLDDQ